MISLVGTDERLPEIARHALLQLAEQIRDTEGKIEAFDKQILSLARENKVCRRLMTVLTVGPFAATALAATVASSLFRLRSPLCRPDRFGPQRDQQCTKTGVASLADPAEPLFAVEYLGARAVVYRVRSPQVAGAWIAGCWPAATSTSPTCSGEYSIVLDRAPKRTKS